MNDATRADLPTPREFSPIVRAVAMPERWIGVPKRIGTAVDMTLVVSVAFWSIVGSGEMVWTIAVVPIHAAMIGLAIREPQIDNVVQCLMSPPWPRLRRKGRGQCRRWGRRGHVLSP